MMWGGVRAARFFCLLVTQMLAAPGAQAEQIKLRVALQLPITSHIGVNLAHFKEEVESRSESALAVEIYDNSRLYKDHEIVVAVASGAIEMGIANYNQFSEKVPAIDIVGLPFLLNTEALVRAATNPDGEIRLLLDEAVLKATGTRVLWWQAYGSSAFFSKQRDVKHPSQILGQKIRVSGENYANLARRCGGIPLVISASKQRKAASDGTVDMITTGITGVDSRELWKVTDVITRTEHAALEFVVIINENVWQALDKNHQTILLASARKVEAALRDEIADIEAKAYEFARAKGMTIHELTPDDVAEWRACSAGVTEDYMKSAGELGSRLMNSYGKLRTQACCSSGPKGTFSLR